MAANVGRWLKYAQAKLNRAIDAGNRDLDQLEAEQAQRVSDKPWLASDGDAPTLEEAKARIEWEAEEQRRRSEALSPPPEASSAPSSTAAVSADARAATPDGPSGPGATQRQDPEVAAARIELDRQARESKERLEEIRKELGVEPPAAPPASA